MIYRHPEAVRIVPRWVSDRQPPQAPRFEKTIGIRLRLDQNAIKTLRPAAASAASSNWLPMPQR
jgi:hypothetical protein